MNKKLIPKWPRCSKIIMLIRLLEKRSWDKREKGKAKRKRSLMPSSCIKRKKQNKLNSSDNKTNNAIINTFLNKPKKMRWKIECKNNRREFNALKSKSSGDKSMKLLDLILKDKSWKKRRPSGKKKLKWCKWKCWRWKWLRSCRTLKPYRNRPILNSNKQLILDHKSPLMVCKASMAPWAIWTWMVAKYRKTKMMTHSKSKDEQNRSY